MKWRKGEPVQWLIPGVPAAQEAETAGLQVKGQARQLGKTLYQDDDGTIIKSNHSRARGVAQG